jgi:outer membrane protein TolC
MRLIFIIFVSFFLIMPSFAAEAVMHAPLTINEVLSLVLKNNPIIKQAEEAVNGAHARTNQKLGAFYPSLDIDATYTRLDPDPAIAFPGLGVMQLFAAENYDTHIALHQKLFDFGKTSGSFKSAKYSQKSVENSAVAIKTNLAFETIQIFYSIILLEQSIDVQEQELKSLNEYLAITQKKLDSGSATSFDVLTIQVKVEEAKDAKIDLENNLTKSFIALKRLAGLEDKNTFDIRGDLTADTADMINAAQSRKDNIYDTLNEDLLVKEALENRPELKAAQNRMQAANMQLGAAKSDNYPSIDLLFEYGKKNGYLPDLNEQLENTVAGAQFKMPIFNGLKTHNQIKEAKAAYMSTQASVEDARNMAVSDVQQIVSDIHTNIEKIKAAELHVKLAEEAVSQAKIRYQSGVITNLDLLNAETALDQAKLLHLKALYSYIISRENLKKAVGAKLWQKEL